MSLASCEIRFAFELFRHGARAPIILRKNGRDIFNETWNMDQELTAVGMRQHYLIGYRNRKNYKNFLSNSFDPKEMYIISTNYNRTIMSAYSQLQGLFPNGTGPELSLFQQATAFPPIDDVDFTSEMVRLGKNTFPNQAAVYPIHIFDQNSRYFDLHNPSVCPAMKELQENNLKKKILRDYIDKFVSKYGEVFMKILNVTVDYFYEYNNIWEITDAFVCDYTEKKELKMLTDANIDLVEFNKTAFEFLSLDILEIAAGDKDNLIGPVTMSPTGLDILKWMQGRIDNDLNNVGYNGYNSPKFVMYSAHDVNMGFIQYYLKKTLNFKNVYLTPFASSIFFELYRENNYDPSNFGEDDYYVMIKYNNDYSTRISFKDFKKGISENSYNSDKIADFCKFKDDVSSNSRFYIVTTFIFGFIALALIIFIGYMVYRNKGNHGNTPSKFYEAV
jgi:hypothetical protein